MSAWASNRQLKTHFGRTALRILVAVILVPLGALVLSESAGIGTKAHAQSSGPLRLVPSTTPSDLADPAAPALQQAVPADGDSQEGQPQDTGPRRQDEAPAGIRVNRLDAPGAAASGLIRAESAGLSSDMWQGTDSTSATALLKVMPTRYASPVVRKIVHRVLISTALPPSAAGPEFGFARVDALIQLGALGDADALLATLPAPASLKDLSIVLRLDFLQGRWEQGCAQAPALLEGETWGEANRIIAACHALRGAPDMANRAFRVLAEEGEADPLITDLAAALDERTAGLDWTIGTVGPIHAALAREASVMPEASLLPAMSPDVLQSFLSFEGLSPEDKLSIAEVAYSAHVIDGARLAQYYTDADASDRLSDALETDPSLLSALDRAALFQAFSTSSTSILKLEAAQSSFAALSAALGTIPAALLIEPYLSTVVPRTDLAWASADLLPIFAHAGELERFSAWFRLADANPEQVPDIALSPYRSARSVAEPQRAPITPRGALLAQALGRDLTADGAVMVLSAAIETAEAVGPAPSGAHALALQNALVNGRTAEAVLLAALALGYSGSSAAPSAPATDPSLLSTIRAFATVGLTEEASALALNAAIAPFAE